MREPMGHESITSTARIYAHLYDDERGGSAVRAMSSDVMNGLASKRP